MGDEKFTSKLPYQFHLGGTAISIRILPHAESDFAGKWMPEQNEIQLCPHGRAYDYMIATFYHELFHAICDIYGRPKDSAKENLMDVLAHGLLQFLHTAKYLDE